jgi:hypothetical protein
MRRQRLRVFGVGIGQAGPATPDADDFVPVIRNPVDHGLDAGIETGDIASTGQDSNAQKSLLTGSLTVSTIGIHRISAPSADVELPEKPSSAGILLRPHPRG